MFRENKILEGCQSTQHFSARVRYNYAFKVSVTACWENAFPRSLYESVPEPWCKMWEGSKTEMFLAVAFVDARNAHTWLWERTVKLNDPVFINSKGRIPDSKQRNKRLLQASNVRMGEEGTLFSCGLSVEGNLNLLHLLYRSNQVGRLKIEQITNT